MSELQQIKTRRSQITREIADALALVKALREEEEELAIAERVLLRLSSSPISTSKADNLQHVDTSAKKTAAIPSKAKPPGTPIIPDMIYEAIDFADMQGKEGETPSGMVSYIAQKWWPEVDIASVGPIAWRMWKKGQLEKDDSTYRRPKSKKSNETPGSEEPGESEHQGDERGSSSSVESQGERNSPGLSLR